MKSLGHYISESESRAESPEPGDVFAFNWREEILIESRIVDVVEDGFVIEGNDHVMALLEQCNCQTEDIARYGPAGDSRGMGLSLSETGIKVDDVDFEQEDTTVDAGEYDYEGDMAKNELHTIVRAARKLAGMLDNDDNMPEWTQKKITKAADYVDTAADYISSQKERGVMEQFQDSSLQDLIKKHKELVRSYNYELQMNDNTHFPYMDEMRDRLKEMWKLIQAKKAADQQSVTEQSQENNPVARAILHRIMMSHPSMLAQYGPEQVMNAVDDVADYIGDVEEIGSSDVSGYVRQVQQMLGGLSEQGVAEAGSVTIGSKLPKSDTETFGLEPGRGYKINQPKDYKSGDNPRAIQQLIPTQDKKDHIRSRLGRHRAPVLPEHGMAEDYGDPEITPGMKTQYGTVVSVKGNTVTVKASNGELTTVNIHDIQQGVAEQGSFSQTPAQKQYGVLHSKLKSLADSGQIDTPVGKQKAEQIIDAIQQLVDTKLSGSTVPSKKIWLSTQGVAEGSQGFSKIKTSYDQASRMFSGEETQGFAIEVLLPNEATFKKIQDTFEMLKNQIGEYLIEKDDSIEGNGIGVVITSPLKQGGQNAQRSYNQILGLIQKSRGQFNKSTGVTIYKRPQGVAEGAEQLHPETLELIDEYIAKIEPDADRDEMIQSVIRGSIHPSELEYALKDDVAEAEYQGRKVPLGKPMRGDVAKSKVYVKDPKTGNVKKVNFGDPNMSIKKSNPERRKSFRARHNCDNPGPRTKARYWSCRAW